MSKPIVRLIIKVPAHVQTGPESWQDTTRLETYDLPCPDDLLHLFEASWRPQVIGAEVITPERELAGGEEDQDE